MNSLIILALLLCIPIALFLTNELQKQKQLNGDVKSFLAVSSLISLGGMLVVGLFIAVAIVEQLRDTELISGQITGKERKHGHYLRSYDCMCTTDSKGNRSCRTCYEDRYTVDWDAYSTIRTFDIKSLDKGSKSVYNTPDPERYTQINVGDPVAVEHSYQNYMKGVPKEYLFNDNLGAPAALIAKIPKYPETYDFYNVNRVVNLDGVLTPAKEVLYNHSIAKELRSLGPTKEVNIILVVGKQDENLVYAVREKWQGGKKNDVIIVLGIEDGNVKAVNVLTWAKNELFKLKLQDRIIDIGSVDNVLPVVYDEVKKSYVRPRMRDYEDLKIYMEPPTWALYTVFGFLVVFTVGGFIFIRKGY